MKIRKVSPVQIGLAVFGVIALIFAFGGPNGLLRSRGVSATPPQSGFRMPVPVVQVIRKTIPVYKEFVGTTEAIRNVTLQAMVTGYLIKQFVPDGTDVHKGALIYRIDPRNFQASLDQANAQKERDAAVLEYSKVNHERNALMVVHGDVSKDAYQLATSSMHQAASSVLFDKAQVELARINLGYTMIRAPFSGRLSRSLVYTGTLIGTGTQINTLVQLDPIYATFNPSEADLAEIQKYRAKGVMEANVNVSGNPATEYKGALTFLDNSVDRSTGTITARVTISNPDKVLLPGQFVHVMLHLGYRKNALLVPQIAIGSNQIGKYLYVVGKGNVVEMRFVVLGTKFGNLIEVKHGVREGESVIVGNQQKIGPGMPVRPLFDKGRSGH